MKFDLENPLTGFDGDDADNDAVTALFAAESDHTPSFKSTDVRSSIRHHSFTLISQAQVSYDIDRFTAYLAVNYIDRFLSKQVVLENKPWIVRILVVASLSLAAKMMNINNLSISHIIIPTSNNNSSLDQSEQRDDEGLIFDLQSIHRMENLILTTLNWRLRSITPFAFLQYYNSLFELSNDESLSQSLEDRAADIIFCSHYEIKLFKYKPSVLASSAFLCAAHELIPQQVSFFLNAIYSKCGHEYKEELLNCWSVMREISVDEISSSSLTPNSVLDQERTSENADRNNRKKRRLNNFQNNQRFHISQKPPTESDRPPTAIMHQPASPRFPPGTPTSGANRKIAIAVDLSDESAYAVKWAVENYLRPGDAVILLHVRPTSVLYGADWGAVDVSIDTTDEKSKQKLEEDFDNFTSTKSNDLAQPLVDANIPFKIRIVKDHDMKERLCLEIERLGLSAVIMGSRGFGASRRSTEGRLGSVSDYCVRHCVCPVIVVRYPDDKDGVPDDDDDSLGNDGSAKKPAKALHPVPEEDSFYHDASDKATDTEKAS